MPYPSHRYSRSWMVQRLMNRAPEYELVRKSPTSMGQQLFNPMALDIQDTVQQLAQERLDMFISTANINQLDIVYALELTPGMEFSYVENNDSTITYTPPTVYATIGLSEVQIEQAEDNDIRTLAYDCLPTRIEDAEVSRVYLPVIAETQIQDLYTVIPEEITIPSHLYVTIKENTTWEQRTKDGIYFPKVHITGKTRKGTIQREVLPIQYNGTFKTINEWQRVDTVFVSYMDETAKIIVEIFPFGRETTLDTRNIFLHPETRERLQFLRLNTQSYGTTLAYETFAIDDMNVIRTTGIEQKEIFYEIELIDESDNSVSLNSFVPLPATRFIYGVDNTTFYVYDTSLPYPDMDNFIESPETLIDLYSDRWIHARDDTVTIKTRNRAVADPPFKYRFGLMDPDGISYYIDPDGTLLPTTEDAWIENEMWAEANWREKQLDILLDKNGEYIVTLESAYINEGTQEVTVLISRFLFFVPAIRPETQLTLPLELANPEKIGLDSDGSIWLYKNNQAHKLNIFHDYFLADYARRKVWFRENYSSVRVVV